MYIYIYICTYICKKKYMYVCMYVCTCIYNQERRRAAACVFECVSGRERETEYLIHALAGRVVSAYQDRLHLRLPVPRGRGARQLSGHLGDAGQERRKQKQKKVLVSPLGHLLSSVPAGRGWTAVMLEIEMAGWGHINTYIIYIIYNICVHRLQRGR